MYTISPFLKIKRMDNVRRTTDDERLRSRLMPDLVPEKVPETGLDSIQKLQCQLRKKTWFPQKRNDFIEPDEEKNSMKTRRVMKFKSRTERTTFNLTSQLRNMDPQVPKMEAL